MKQGELVNLGSTRMTEVDGIGKIGRLEFLVEHIMPVCTERMRITETIGRNLLPLVNQHFVDRGCFHATQHTG